MTLEQAQKLAITARAFVEAVRDAYPRAKLDKLHRVAHAMVGAELEEPGGAANGLPPMTRA